MLYQISRVAHADIFVCYTLLAPNGIPDTVLSIRNLHKRNMIVYPQVTYRLVGKPEILMSSSGARLGYLFSWDVFFDPRPCDRIILGWPSVFFPLVYKPCLSPSPWNWAGHTHGPWISSHVTLLFRLDQIIWQKWWNCADIIKIPKQVTMN